MKILALMLMAFTLLSGSAWAQTTDLFISEYVEGSSNNKALEIFNGSGDLINLNEYSVLIYANGGSTPVQTIALDDVSMDSDDTFVLASSNAGAELQSYSNQLSSSLSFNGDDAVVLVKGEEVIDSIGTIGFDPGSGWSCDDGSTVNNTLRRRAEICNGDTDPSDDFNVCLEWTFFAIDTFDGLGQHSSDCSSVSLDINNWGSLKAVYR